MAYTWASSDGTRPTHAELVAAMTAPAGAATVADLAAALRAAQSRLRRRPAPEPLPDLSLPAHDQARRPPGPVRARRPIHEPSTH